MRARAGNAKPKKNIFKDESCYQHYNPDVEGFGDARQWLAAFRVRMSLDEAKQRVNDRSPLGILFGDSLPIGFMARTLVDQWAEIKKAYRKLSVEFYPEERNGAWHGDNEKFLTIQAAYLILKDRYQRKGVTV